MAQYYREWNDTFINPYNFVSINKRSNNRKDIEQRDVILEKLHTGYLQCKLITRTPLAIPDIEKKKIEKIKDNNGKEKEHTIYPFYTIGEQQNPIIPGSSIRGVLRTVYEAVTDSCMVTGKENAGLTARVDNKKAYCAGLLIQENKEWKLYKAERYLIPIKGKNYKKFDTYNKDTDFEIVVSSGKRYLKDKTKEYQNGECVEFEFFAESESESKPKPYIKNRHLIWNGIVKKLNLSNDGDAYVYIGEEFANKHGESLFQKGALEEENQKIICNAMKGLEETIKIYRDPAINRNYKENHSGYENYEETKEKGVIPVWYKRDRNHLYFCAASIGRMQYNNRIIHLIGDKKACEKRNSLCKACSLFGMAAGTEAVGSKIRVSDAIGIKYRFQQATLKELGMPRASYMPFYAEKVIGRNVDLCTSYDEEGAGIRGRKFYWHNPSAKEDFSIYTTEEKTDRNATMDLALPGAEFVFKIYYDGITQQQLDELIWTITFWENKEDGELCHKIGHGKPLGLGSVKIVITDKMERSIDNGQYKIDRSNVLFGKMPVQEMNPIVREILKICNYNILKGERICYPYVKLDDESKEKMENIYSDRELNDNVLASHQWFTQNKGTKKDAETPCIIDSILNENQRLPVYYVTKLNEKNFKQENTKREVGTIKFFNKEKKYGYIKRDGKEDIYMNGDSVNEDTLSRIRSGIKVEFTIDIRERTKAKNCKIIE